MADIFSKSKRSEVMSKIRSKDTKPEMRVRKFIFSSGFRYRLHRNNLIGNPDLGFPRYKTIIFVHGCFWHGHPCKIGSGNRKPKTNIKYWHQKIAKNIQRDKYNRRTISKMGWNVIVIWECETTHEEKLGRKLKPLFHMKANA